MLRAAFLSGILTLCIGFALGVPGFFAYASGLADANNRWMLDSVAHNRRGANSSALAGYAASSIAPFLFLLTTWTGRVSVYLVASGALRAAGAWFDDPHGDFLLSAIDSLVASGAARNRRDRTRIARERLEGAEAPDVLKTGKWAGVDADYVLLASRRKPEWETGAIVMSGDDWYRLGTPFDMETPAGLRTAYPLTLLETVEVVRRGILYQLPPLRGSATTQTRRDASR